MMSYRARRLWLSQRPELCEFFGIKQTEVKMNPELNSWQIVAMWRDGMPMPVICGKTGLNQKEIEDILASNGVCVKCQS